MEKEKGNNWIWFSPELYIQQGHESAGGKNKCVNFKAKEQ